MSYRPYAACAAMLVCAAALLTAGCPGRGGRSAKSAGVDTSPPGRPPDSDVGQTRVTTLLACVKDGTVWLMDGQGNHRREVKAPGQAIPESLSWASDSSRLAFWTSEDDRGEGAFSLCAVEPEHPEGTIVMHKTTPGLGGDH